MPTSPAVFPLASILRRAGVRIVIITADDRIEARTLMQRPDVVRCTIVEDGPLPIDEVHQLVTMLLPLTRQGFTVALTGEAAEEVAITAICAAVALGVPSADVVSEIGTLGWIDIPSYVEFAEDFREYWIDRRSAA